MNRKYFLKIGLFTTLLSWAGLAAAQTSAVLIYDDTQPAIAFSAGELKAALEQKSQFTVATVPTSQMAAQTAPVQVVVTTNGVIAGQPPVTGLAKEGYAIRKVTAGGFTRWWVIGNDASGAMYAGLELADSARISGSLIDVVDKQVNPNLTVRGIKYNIPLDARTPSYADDSTAAQANIPDVWETSFWHPFLDQMARSRLNYLSLWSTSPFPSLVKTPGYENASLADVMRKTGSMPGGSSYSTSWQLETVKTMTIEQKIAFWQGVMQYAKDRGVDVSLFTWNLFVFGTETSGYGLTNSTSNVSTKDYIRKSVRSLFNTYPLLAGIGVTAGENMPNLTNAQEEQWLWDTYGQGFKDALLDNPGRKIKFIHRPHYTDVASIKAQFSQLPGFDDADSSLRLTFKYSEAHMHSSTKPLFFTNSEVRRNFPAGKKVALEVRNDDFYNLRWGDPEFARDYLNNIPDRDKIDGFMMGPDGFTWGREVVSKNPDAPRQLHIHKLWYNFMVWGHLAYDPLLPNGRFQDLLGARYPEVPSGSLYTGLASVSKIFPLVTRFFWGPLDFHWYPEASLNLDNAYLGVQSLIDPLWSPMSASQDGQTQLLMSVKDFVNGVSPNGRLTPVQVASLLEQYANTGIQNVQSLNPGANKDLRETIVDVKAMASLGLYYSQKILGAVDRYRFQKNAADSVAQASAKDHLQKAANHWRDYATQWSSQYLPQQLGRVGKFVDLVAMQTYVDADITAGSPTPPATPTVRSFTVVNADTGADIATFISSGTVSVASTPNINVRADVTSVGSVVFTDGASSLTESSAPYAYKSDTGGVYKKWAPAPGTYVINATPYSGSGGTGAAGATATLALTITGTAAPPTSAYDITSLVLVNASNGLAIRTLQPNETLSLSSLGATSISIRALPDAGPKSVKFESAAAAVSRTEGGAPWAFLGNSGTVYTPWVPAVKTYTITATGYSASGASGTAGKPLSVVINVVP